MGSIKDYYYKDNISKSCCKENCPLEPKIDVQWDSNYCCRLEEE